MKKIFLIALIPLMLCGCQKAKPEYLVSSIGFDYVNGKYQAAFEAVISNSETDEQTVKLIIGKGETVEKAVNEIAKQSTQKLLLSHCALIVLGENLTSKNADEIYDYCFNNEDITLSVLFVKTANAQQLLLKKPISTVAVGYDILSLIQQIGETKDIRFKNRYFEIMAGDKKAKLPKITLTEEGYYFEG